MDEQQDTTAEDIYAMLAVDPTAEAEGIWHTIGTSRFRVRSSSSPEVEKARTRALRGLSRVQQANNGVLPPEMAAKLLTEVAVAELTGWENVPVPPWWPEAKTSKAPLPFNRENAVKLLGDPRMRRLREMIQQRASDDDAFRQAEIEKTAGNSPSASAGT